MTNDLNNSPQQKKVWQKPEIYILGTGYVEGGGHNGFFLERNIKSTSPAPSVQFHFHMVGGGTQTVGHSKGYYHS